MPEAIAGLKPELLWRHFADIARIPRPSKHEERIARHVLDTSARLGLEAGRDACGNIVVRKPASPGREDAPAVCLQAHLDMVCEKNEDKVHDFMNDPIELVRKGPFLMANGTTLGADNGVGVATNLAVMEDRTLVHGPLELLFTVDEETGLAGAKNLDPALVRSRTLLNLDSEEEGALYVGCAGGRDTEGRWQARYEAAPAGTVALQLSVTGLKGGHSGIDIHRGLGNAIKIANRALMRLFEVGARLASMNGGKMRNAIPRECTAVLCLPREGMERAVALIEELNASIRAEFVTLEPDLTLRAMPLDTPKQVLEADFARRLCLTIAALPHGVLHMSADIHGLVETSTNVAVVTTTDQEIVLVTSQRSSVASRLDEAVASVQAAFALGGAAVRSSDGYPGWKPNLSSPILKIAKECHLSLYGKAPAVKAVHAGLECGLLGERVPGIDMVSFGPTLESVHSPDEKIHIDSVERFWDFLAAILEKHSA